MKVQIIYSSLSGKTRRLAEYLYEGLNAEEKSIHDLKDGVPTLDGDVLLELDSHIAGILMPDPIRPARIQGISSLPS